MVQKDRLRTTTIYNTGPDMNSNILVFLLHCRASAALKDLGLPLTDGKEILNVVTSQISDTVSSIGGKPSMLCHCKENAE